MERSNLTTDYFSDYVCYSEKDITEVTNQGIRFSNGSHLSFVECTYTYAEIHKKQISKCIGERNIEELRFVLYTPMRPTIIRFPKKPWIAELFSKPAYQRFHKFQNAIVEKGFSTLDLS